MLRKTMIALCAMASIGMLAPDMALAHGGGGGGGHGGGGGGHGGGFGGGHGGFGGGGFGGRGGFAGGGFGARTVSGGNFNGSFARAAPNGRVGAVQGNRFAGSRMGRGFGRDHDHDRDFRHHRRFFVGDDFFVGNYWDYPDYAYGDSYFDNDNCYVVRRRVHTPHGWRVRPVQVCG